MQEAQYTLFSAPLMNIGDVMPLDISSLFRHKVQYLDIVDGRNISVSFDCAGQRRCLSCLATLVIQQGMDPDVHMMATLP
jgi:hypothetical protein